MDCRTPILSALLLCSLPAAAALAQSSSPSTSPAVPSEEATQSPAPTTTVASDQPPAKKVWTNDDMSGVRDDSGIPNHPAPAKKPAGVAVKPPASKGPATPKGKDAKWYQDQIAKLQAQLPPLESQISDLQAALSGQSVDAVRKFGWLRPDDWKAQLAQLQQKRDGIFTKIGALEDEARHSGVATNTLP